jgi:hypothetical protein
MCIPIQHNHKLMPCKYHHNQVASSSNSHNVISCAISTQDIWNSIAINQIDQYIHMSKPGFITYNQLYNIFILDHILCNIYYAPLQLIPYCISNQMFPTFCPVIAEVVGWEKPDPNLKMATTKRAPTHCHLR